MAIFVAGIEIKKSTKHVEAAIDVFSGLGFKSPRLQSRSVGIRAVELKCSAALLHFVQMDCGSAQCSHLRHVMGMSLRTLFNQVIRLRISLQLLPNLLRQPFGIFH